MQRYDQILARAQQLHEAGRLVHAEELYRRLLKKRPDDTLTMHNLSVNLFTQGRREEAVTLMTEVLNKNKDVPDYFETMAAFLTDPEFSRELRNPWGGPFNGQSMRRRIFLEIIARVRPECIFETGTYRGATTEFMASTNLPIFSCENEIDRFRFAHRRLNH